MISKDYFKSFVNGLRINSKGQKIGKKLVIFESDDWGSIRTPNLATVKKSAEFGTEILKSRYHVDGLATAKDLERLYETLEKHKDSTGNSAVFTANSIVANADYEKIKESEFQQYFYEPFTETLKRYPNHNDSFSLWNEGMERRIFIPQFHGREHLNINRWLKALKQGDKFTRHSFDLGFNYSGKADYSYMAGFDWDSEDEVESHKRILREGLSLFESIFGFQSQSFISMNYIWDSKLEEVLHDKNVQIIQGLNKQLQPNGSGNFTTIYHSFGSSNKDGLIYNVRNCTFEPVTNRNADWIDKTLARMRAAFLMGKPAIISTHRLNYIGYIDQNNADFGLNNLNLLLKKMLQVWPDIEFASTPDLLKYFNNGE